MTRTQVFAALALLKKVLPDLASVEVSGNPDKPLMVQVVRFSDGEQLEAPRPVLDMGKLIEIDTAEAAAIEAESVGARYGGRKNGHATIVAETLVLSDRCGRIAYPPYSDNEQAENAACSDPSQRNGCVPIYCNVPSHLGVVEGQPGGRRGHHVRRHGRARARESLGQHFTSISKIFAHTERKLSSNSTPTFVFF